MEKSYLDDAMLILEPKAKETIILTDEQTGDEIRLQYFRRPSGPVAVGIDAPARYKIIRTKNHE